MLQHKHMYDYLELILICLAKMRLNMNELLVATLNFVVVGLLACLLVMYVGKYMFLLKYRLCLSKSNCQKCGMKREHLFLLFIYIYIIRY